MSGSWDDDDDFLLDDESDASTQDIKVQTPWVMLIVDDEKGIHDVTQLALQRFSYEGRGLEFLSAYSADEALRILKSNDDVAVILLDVVMETDHAGLECARQIRDELHNETVRIVLRTGQPGQAPEKDVILAYDINDYRAKTELSADRLFTTVISALRSYRDIKALEQYREDAYAMLEQNAQSAQNLIDIAQAPLFQLGTDNDIQRCNEAFARLVGQDITNLIGCSLQEIDQAALHIACIEKQEDVIIKGQHHTLSLRESGAELYGHLKAKR